MTHPTDTAKSEELKACPWGHEGIVKLEEPNHGRKGYCVCCFVCGSSPGAFDTPAEAIAAWNRRSSPPQNDAGVEGLREALNEARSGFEAVQVLLSAMSNGRPSIMVETFIERIDAALSRTPMSELQALGQEFEAGIQNKQLQVRLIAAASEMLHALECVVSSHDSGSYESDGMAIDYARVIIAKVQGMGAGTIEAEMREWQSMDSAPQDWTDVLVYSPDHEDYNCGGRFSGFYDPESGQWLTHQPGGNMPLNPTHWRPLPSAPSGEGNSYA